jgi:type IV fimbrial biogenesis protein FimT
MVTIAVLAITLALAAPSFGALINSNRLVGQANELVASVHLARSEAIRRNARVAVCGSTDGSACSTSATEWTYWLVVVVSSSEVLRAGKVKGDVQLTPSAAVQDNSDQVVFSADGLARDASGSLLVGSIAVCLPTTQPEQNTRRLTIAGGSRVHTLSENTSASCGVPDDE